jgi:hypothetical protein
LRSPPESSWIGRVASAGRPKRSEGLSRASTVAAAFEMKRSEMRRAAPKHHLEHGEREATEFSCPTKGQSAREGAPIQIAQAAHRAVRRALPWIERAAEQAQQRRLARAVGPDDREHFTGLDFQRHAV